MALVDEFFVELDALWRPRNTERIELKIIGAGALMLQCNYERGTKDSDVLETTELTPEHQSQLLELAGIGSELHTRRRIYVDIVRSGIPFLPRPAAWHPVPSLADLRSFDLRVLDVVDVAVSKLKRFSANDLSDIDAMIERDLVPHERFLE